MRYTVYFDHPADTWVATAEGVDEEGRSDESPEDALTDLRERIGHV